MSKDNSIYMLTGVDALGRSIEPVGAFNAKQVGVFYFLWIGQHRSASFDNSELDISVQKNDRSGEDVHHYWAKPLFGYYDSGDPWVFRRHLQMLTLAGVDYLVFDTTNSYYYETVCHNIFPVALAMLDEGWNIPRFMFDTNCRSSETVEGIYKAYYDPKTENGKKYARLWYRHGDYGNRNAAGKPWIIAKNNEVGENAKYNYDALPAEIKDFFYLRESAWFVEDQVKYAFATDVDNPTVHEGMLSVSVAQHTSGAFSDSVFEPDGRKLNRGRGYSATDGKNDVTRVAQGSCYEGEWQAALHNKDVDSVFLSTFNEWVAQKQPYGHCGRSCCYFVDQYNTEFSRDIEPSCNELGDNYYMQTVRNIRKFKSAGKSVPRAGLHTVHICGDDSEWRRATAYPAFTGDSVPRNYKSANENLPPYKADGAVNDVKNVRVACDEDNVYFNVECVGKINKETSCGKHLNILLFDGNGQQFAVNTQACGAPVTVVKDGKTVGNAECCLRGDSIRFAIPRAVLGLGGKDCEFSFQITDGVDLSADILTRYSVGKCVPMGRFRYYFACGQK